tara:strand:+ start:200 stop:580 length:381 start_codon:yes stop_codon:yes gene_type:complete
MSRKKDLYWHRTAHLALEYGLKPAQVSKIVKEVFPETDVNGRHIGAYKRRLVTEGSIPTEWRYKPNINSVTTEAIESVTDVDMFVYNCSIGSIKQSLKCFEYKMTAEVVNEMEDLNIWLESIEKQE